MSKPEVLPYGVALRDVHSRGDLDEMKSVVATSSALMALHVDDPATVSKEWIESHIELQSAVNLLEPIKIKKRDIYSIEDGVVVVNNVTLGNQLRASIGSDVESDAIYLITIRIEF